MDNMRIAVISDIHAAYAPFETALTDARRMGFDQLILLGDLFTYGIEPLQCAELAKQAIEHDGALLIGGNHDQLYLDLEQGEHGYYDGLPDWIRESVDINWKMLGGKWPKGLPWLEEWNVGGLYMAHANPFGYGDWTYLSDAHRMNAAANSCASRGFRYGVFGHLHRPMNFSSGAAEVHVVGSVGQPRCKDSPRPHWAMIDLSDQAMTLTRHDIDFDAAAHLGAIRSFPGLSEQCKDRLCGFFE